MEPCIFCKIINKEIPAAIQHEDDLCVAFNDIHPKARVHILLVPKKHIPTISDLAEGDEKIIGHLVKTAKDLALKHACKGYQLLFNVGREAGQIVFHVHLHLMGNSIDTSAHDILKELGPMSDEEHTYYQNLPE